MSTMTKATASAAPTTATPSANTTAKVFKTSNRADDLITLLVDLAGRGKAKQGHKVTNDEMNLIRYGYTAAKNNTLADKVTKRDKTFEPKNDATYGYYFDRGTAECQVFIYKLKTVTKVYAFVKDRAPF